jgi:hypothetical protein
MAKHDPQARPVFHRKRDSIEVHLTIVFAALAVRHWIETATGWSIRKFVRTARRYRTITIQAGANTITAAPACRVLDAGLRPGPFPDDTASLLPDLLAATRTGLSPAGNDELTNTKIHHGLRHGVTSRAAGRTKSQG